MSAKIKTVHARQILDSRGNPTAEVDVMLSDGGFGRAAVPSGASTGEYEAVELRDNDKSRYLGRGVLKAVDNVNKIISLKTRGMDALKQTALDRYLIEFDGTDNKSRLGANAILGVSLAVAKAAANSKRIPLYKYITSIYRYQKPSAIHHLPSTFIMPIPLMNILNGGLHADNNLDIQEFMIMPIGADTFSEALRMGVEVFHALKSILKKKGLITSVGDEGGFAPNLESNELAIQTVLEAIEKAGYVPGRDIYIALDVAASSLYQDGSYIMKKSTKEKKTSAQMLTLYKDWSKKYPIASIEDGLGENDWDGWRLLTKELGNKCQLVGDDLFVTNTRILSRGIEEKTANAILIKVNQIGTLTETFEAIALAAKHNYKAVISHRSGETEDTTISHIAVGTNAGQIKTGSASRTDRIAKYNELLRIEETLGKKAVYAGELWGKRGS